MIPRAPMHILASTLAALALSSFSTAATVAQQGPLDAAARSAAVDRIGQLLEERYVSPEIGKQCRAHIAAELADGAFDDCTAAKDFATNLTEALQSISHDKHLRVWVRPPERAAVVEEDPATMELRMSDRLRARNFFFERAERMEGNVGYVDMRGFARADVARDTAAAAMAFVSNCDALIFDMRHNGGGDPALVQFVCSYFFAERTHLNSLYFREGDRTMEFWTLDDVPGKRMPDVPLFVLTSKETFSGAEEFAYNLRSRDRATIIGETTRGGANPGRVMRVDDLFEVFLPMGRAINPVTGTNWEGTGVEPHIVAPSAEALDVALQKARPAAKQFREQRETRRQALRDRVTESVRAAKTRFEQGQDEAAIAAIEAALQAGRLGGVVNEHSINLLGYDQLQAGNIPSAIAIFRFNVANYPQSANAWDSLGEAYMKHGQRELAIANYEKSLELDPRNDNATRMLEQLEKR